MYVDLFVGWYDMHGLNATSRPTVALVRLLPRVGAIIKRFLPFIFVLFSLPVSAFFALSMPPSFFADELPHVMRADSLIHGEILGLRATVPHPDGGPIVLAGVNGDMGLVGVGFAVPSTDLKITRAEIQKARDQTWSGVGFNGVTNTAVYAPIFYLPSAIALGLSKALGASPLVAIIVGRLVNLCCYEILAVVALCLTRHGSALLFSMLTLPISLAVAGSFVQDGLMIATMALAAALFSRCLAATNSHAQMVRQPEFWVGSVALSCVILAKPPYLPLAAAVWIPLPWYPGNVPDKGTMLRLFCAMLLCVVPALVWSWVVTAYVATPFIRPDYVAGPLFPGDPHTVFRSTDMAAQMLVLRTHPIRLIALTFQTIWSQSRDHINELIGVLGMLNVVLPHWLYGLWRTALVAAIIEAMLIRPSVRSFLQPVDCILPLIGGCICVIGTFLIQYLSWTPVGAGYIDGVQGRYFVPLLAYLLLALPRVEVRGACSVRTICTILPIVAAAVGLFVLPTFIVFTYYLN
jgi:uncharacterized membrane protein